MGHGQGERAGFTRRTVVLDPGTTRPSTDTEWRDALVVLLRGEVDLECLAGGRRRFRAGAVLWLVGIGLRALHNVGVGPAVLLVVARRSGHDPPCATPS